jgi:rifampicin phosphotransferase
VPGLVVALDDPGAEPAVVGGKGASLARLVRAGFNVPPGFCVTTGAYQDQVVPAAEIAAAYAGLGDDVPVAVRSSATAEDRPGMSAAGQYDTYLNISGEAALLDAIKRCWASLGSERATEYRARRGTDDVSMAVVVQAMVPADAAGVLFTADPVSGARDRVVISANWGLGESVVAGEVTPDVAVVRGGALLSYQTGTKETMTTSSGSVRTPAARRGARVLSAEQAVTLAATGLAIEKLYGQPMDIEWALAGGEFSVLQARPITGPTEAWNDSLDGDYLWSNGNVGEAVPDVMTPATWSFAEVFMPRMMFPPNLGTYRGYGRIGGRFYVNVSMSMALESLVGIWPRRFVTLLSPVLGQLPPASDIPRPRLPRRLVIRMLATVISKALTARANAKRLPSLLAAFPGRCDELRASIERAADAAALASLWPGQVRPLIVEAADALTAAGSRTTALLTVPGQLSALVGEADAALLLSGGELASLGPVIGLTRLASGEIDRDTFIREYGHRGPHELELSTPRPAEDPAWIDEQLATVGDAAAMLARQVAARAVAWKRLDHAKAAKARPLVARWAPIARDREAARSEVVRTAWVARAWVRRAGELTGHGDDLFFLSLDEVAAVLRGDAAPLTALTGRRASYETYRGLPPYPPLIRGHFDPVGWAAGRSSAGRSSAGSLPVESVESVVRGFPGSAGIVTGTARVLRDPSEAGQLRDGEILVTTATNVGWTPVFPRAAAIVTDVGAPLSHAAIVARELGIPAVVGCRDATTAIRAGDQLRVDGSAGTVQILR